MPLPVSALADAIAATNPPAAPTPHSTPVVHPKGWEPGYVWDGNTGSVNTGPVTGRPDTWDAYLIDAGMNPADVEVIEPVNVRGWDSLQASIDPDTKLRVSSVVRMHYYKLNVRRITSATVPDLRQLFLTARATRKTAKATAAPPVKATSATVVCWADPQTGKVASRGGTTQLIERQQGYLEGIEAYSRKHRNQAAYLFDLGDLVEGFENVPAQAFTNDLSLMDQIDIATTVELEAVKMLARTHPSVVMAGVGSNHCRWRSGKGALGLPGDDWGIFALKQIRKALALNPERFGHVSVVWPDKHEETLALDVAGTIIGLAHGHQVNNPDHIPLWWAKQTHGGQALADADILLTGHFHHLRLQPTGQNRHTGRSKWWVMAPSMDNGSDWWRHGSGGSDSDPGLLMFSVNKHGWIRDSLTLL
jgi:hypothetical protein